MKIPMDGPRTKRRFKGRATKLTALIALAGVLLAACASQPGTSTGSTSGGTTGQTAAAPTAPAPSTATASGSSSSTASVSFSKDVEPILQGRCVACHGGAHTNKGLNLTSYSNLMAGGVDGPAVLQGNPTNSLLIQMVVQGKMPKSGPLLLPSQIQILTQWVQEGAPNN